MVVPLAKWVFRRYAMLWKEFGEESFSFEQAKNVLKEDNPSLIIVMLHEMRKAGWLIVKDDENDSRRSRYTLQHPEDLVNEIEA